LHLRLPIKRDGRRGYVNSRFQQEKITFRIEPEKKQ
jgi:hypothetical protein